MECDVMPGLPDTGGQSVFVNQFSLALAKFGYKITIVNQGGYPHPVTNEWQRGVDYQDRNQRIIYLEDGQPVFVRKEDMAAQLPALVQDLNDFLKAEGTTVDLIISHYWDAAKLGILYNQTLLEPVKHIWVPHSLGAIKKQNVDESEWPRLRIDERIEIEKDMIKRLDGIASTSSVIRHSPIMIISTAAPIFFCPHVLIQTATIPVMRLPMTIRFGSFSVSTLG